MSYKEQALAQCDTLYAVVNTLDEKQCKALVDGSMIAIAIKTAIGLQAVKRAGQITLSELLGIANRALDGK